MEEKKQRRDSLTGKTDRPFDIDRYRKQRTVSRKTDDRISFTQELKEWKDDRSIDLRPIQYETQPLTVYR